MVTWLCVSVIKAPIMLRMCGRTRFFLEYLYIYVYYILPVEVMVRLMYLRRNKFDTSNSQL